MPTTTDDRPVSPTPTPSPSHGLRGRVALITGGSRGLGAAMAHTLAEAGMRLALVDIAAQRVLDLAAALAEREVEAMALPMDLGDAPQCARAVDDVVRHFGRLDVLINNAAVDVTAPIGELTEADWQRIAAVNLGAPFLLSKHAAAVMAAQGGGHIVNIASTAAKRGWPNASAYHATKWGLLGLSQALHAELRSAGVKVCALVAGGMRTPFLTDRFPELDISRLQEPLDVARVVRFVLEQPASTCIAEITVVPLQETSWP